MQTVRPTNSQTVAAIIRSGLEFHIDDVQRAQIEGAALLRIAVTGIAVKFTASG